MHFLEEDFWPWQGGEAKEEEEEEEEWEEEGG